MILCANRDEFLSRPTLDAHFHSFGANEQETSDHVARSQILSGLDIRAGGSWLGVSRNGRVCVLTNVTEPFGKYASSRGFLIQSFLKSSTSGLDIDEEMAKFTAPDEGIYAGFNLLLFAPKTTPLPTTSHIHSTTVHSHAVTPRMGTSDPRPEQPHAHSCPSHSLSMDAAFVSNYGARGKLRGDVLTEEERSRTGCFSNDAVGLKDSSWPKVTCLKQLFEDALQEHDQSHGKHGCVGSSADILDSESVASGDDERLASRLFQCLSWRSVEPVRVRSDLRQTVRVDPVGIPAKQAEVAQAAAVLTSIPGLSRFPLVPQPQSGSAAAQEAPPSPFTSSTSELPKASGTSSETTSGEVRQSSARTGADVSEGAESYGTRLSTVILIRKDGSVLFIERDIWKVDTPPSSASQSASRGDPTLRSDELTHQELSHDLAAGRKEEGAGSHGVTSTQGSRVPYMGSSRSDRVFRFRVDLS